MPTRINISVTSDALYKSLSGSVQAGALYVLDAFPTLYQRTLSDMRDVYEAWVRAYDLMEQYDEDGTAYDIADLFGEPLSYGIADSENGIFEPYASQAEAEAAY